MIGLVVTAHVLASQRESSSWERVAFIKMIYSLNRIAGKRAADFDLIVIFKRVAVAFFAGVDEPDCDSIGQREEPPDWITGEPRKTCHQASGIHTKTYRVGDGVRGAVRWIQIPRPATGTPRRIFQPAGDTIRHQAGYRIQSDSIRSGEPPGNCNCTSLAAG